MPTSALRIDLQVPTGKSVTVGFLRHHNERNWFEIEDEYWATPNRPVLGQVFEEHGPAWKPSARTALPRWFSHLLPEGRLRLAVADAAQVSSAREFELLARLGGTDLPGAVIATRVTEDDIPVTPALADELELAVEDPVLKFSLAGVQLKFSVYADGNRLTVPVRGQAGNFIVKFPDGRPGFDGVPEAELGSLELARAARIEAPPARLVRTSDIDGLESWAEKFPGSALAVERFDRTAEGGRIHMEELAQVMDIAAVGERAKYEKANFETIAVLAGALTDTKSVGKVIDRIVLNVLLGNGDAHLKNWAILYPDGRLPVLSPVYDVVPTSSYITGDDLGLNLNKSKSFEEVTTRSFDRIGARTDYGVEAARQRAKNATERIMNAWPTLNDYLSAPLMKSLNVRLRTLNLINSSE